MTALEHVVVRPGDTLIVRIPVRANMAEVDECQTALAEQLPGVRVVVAPADQLLVYRPSEVCDARSPASAP